MAEKFIFYLLLIAKIKIQEDGMVLISTTAFKIDDYIHAEASCTVYFCYTCIKCGHKSKWIPLELKLTKDSGCDHNETETIIINDDLEHAKVRVHNELYNYIKELESMPNTGERCPKPKYWNSDEKLKCSACNTFQSWYNTSVANKDIVGFLSMSKELRYSIFVSALFIALYILNKYLSGGIRFSTIAILLIVIIFILLYTFDYIQNKIANAKLRRITSWLFEEIKS